MKKLVVTLLTVLACGSAYALPVGNPADPSLLTRGIFWDAGCYDPSSCASWLDCVSFRFGFDGDYVYNRHLEVGDNSDGEDTGRIIDDSSLSTNAGYLVLNFWNRLDVFARLGASRFTLDSAVASLSGAPVDTRFHFESTTHFSWGVGGRLTLWECGCTAVGVEGEYFQSTPLVNYISIADAGAVYPLDSRFKYAEWQVGAGITHRINAFAPYVAVKYSRANLTFGEDGTPIPGVFGPAPELSNQKHWGYAVGLTLLACDMASFTAEARFADEKAFHVNAQIRF